MASLFAAHRVTAVVVLVDAAAWVITSEFSAVGSEEPSEAATIAETTATAVAALLRTVDIVVPMYADYAREIRVSGAIEADKSAVLAVRADGLRLEAAEAKAGMYCVVVA